MTALGPAPGRPIRPMPVPAPEGALEGLYHPAHQPRGGALVCHPHPLYGGNMHNRVVVAASYGLVRASLSTLRFNFRGTGRSPGHFDGGRGEREDVRAALAGLAARVPGLPLVVAGYSFGASVGLPIGARDDRVIALLGIGVPLEFGGPPPVAPHQGTLLLVQGDRDEFGPVKSVEAWASTLSLEVEVVTVAGADHFFEGDLVQDVAVAAERLGRRITGSSPPRPAP